MCRIGTGFGSETVRRQEKWSYTPDQYIPKAAATPALSAEKPEGGVLRSAVQNPISSLISLPFKFNFDFGAPNGEATFLNIQPVIPVTVGDWNLVNRVIVPLIDSPGEVAGTPDIPSPIPGNGATGLGDIKLFTLFFAGEVRQVHLERGAFNYHAHGH